MVLKSLSSSTKQVVDIHAGRTRGGAEEGGWVDVQELTHPSSQFSWLMPGADDKVREKVCVSLSLGVR